MKKRSKILNSLLASSVFAAIAACGGGPSYDPESPEGEAFMYRDSVMELARQKSLVILGMAREEIPLDEAVFVKATADLAALAGMMIDGFDNQTLVAESRTDPAVWDNWDDFQDKMNNLIEATQNLAETAATGGFAAAQGLAQPTVQVCGTCHNPYRLSEAE